MAASANDKFLYVGNPGTATTLSAPGYTIGNTSITVGSTANFPTATGVIFAIDTAEIVDGEEVQVNGTYCVFSGTVTDGTTLSDLSLEYGTPQNYASGALTRVYIPISAIHNERLIDGILVAHDQDGTLKDNAVVTANITDLNVTTGKLADNAVTTAKITDANVTTAKLADTSVTPGKLDLTTPTMVAQGTSTTLSSIPARNYLRVIIYGVKTSAAGTVVLRFNGDSGNNYATRVSSNGGSDATATNDNVAAITSSNTDTRFYCVFDVKNISGENKIFIGTSEYDTPGAANAPTRQERVLKWASTEQIDEISLTASSAVISSVSITVIGHN